MSIAVSLMIRPSRCLQMVVSGFCVLIFAMAGMVVSGLTGSFSLAGKALVGMAGLLGVATSFLVFRRQQQTWQMNISPEGVIRLCRETHAGQPDETSGVFRLLPDSTLWSGVMLLRLQSDAGQIVSLCVLSDSVAPHEFRALSVALRWIAARVAVNERELYGRTSQ